MKNVIVYNDTCVDQKMYRKNDRPDYVLGYKRKSGNFQKCMLFNENNGSNCKLSYVLVSPKGF